MRALIYTDAEDMTETTEVEVAHIVSAGILINDNAGDEVDEKLIPWHRVWEVYSRVEGELYLETGR